jgi:citrate lyase beta subunit
MWSIHPNQIVPIVEMMRPDFSEVESAAAILIAAQDGDWGPIQHQGRCTTALPTATTGSFSHAPTPPA